MATSRRSTATLSGQPMRRARPRPSSRGVALIFALLALVVLSLGSVALVRSVGTGAMLLGNLGMKQDATRQADIVTQQVVNILYTKQTASSTTLQSDGAFTGYYASVDDTLLDTTGQQLPSNASRLLIQWTSSCSYVSTNNSNCNYTPQSVSSVGDSNTTAQYVVFRLCSSTGASSSSTCATPTTSSSLTKGGHGGSNGTTSGSGSPTTTSGPYYRIVVRVAGSRNAVSYTETLIHF